MNTPIREALHALGIELTGARWHRILSGGRSKTVFAAETVCWCTGTPWRLSMVPFAAKGRRIHLTQCPHCREIIWSLAHPDEEWTGPKVLTAAPLYEALDRLPAPVTRPHEPPTPP